MLCSRNTLSMLNSFLADLDDGGFDHVLELLLGLIPHHQAITARISGHVGVANASVDPASNLRRMRFAILMRAIGFLGRRASRVDECVPISDYYHRC